MYKKLCLITLLIALIGLNTYKTIKYLNDDQNTSEQAKSSEIDLSKTEPATLNPILIPICACESDGKATGTPRQFNDDGSVHFGKINPLDTGMCQINQKYWLETAQSLGYDIFTEQGNIKMANWIYNHYGTQPWSWSSKCWTK